MASANLPNDFVVAPTAEGSVVAVPYAWLDDWIGHGETRWTRWGHYVAFAHIQTVLRNHSLLLAQFSEHPTPMATASQIGRLMTCSGGAFLPRASDLRDERAAERGTEIHAEILDENAQSLKGAFLWEWLHKDLAQGGSSTERAAILYSDGKVVDLGRLETHRAYEPEPGRVWAVGGTEDAGVTIIGKDFVEIRVADLKTGHAQLYRGTLAAPADAWQLRTLAVLRWVLAGRPAQVRVRMAWALWDDEDQRGWIDEAPCTFSYTDVLGWEYEIAGLMLAMDPSKDAEYKRGPHCRTCSSFTFCPAQRTALAAIESVVPDLASVVPEDLEALTEAQLGDLYWNLTAIEEQAARARDALSVLVERRSAVPVGQGREAVVKRNLIRRIVNHKKVAALAGKIGLTSWFKQEVTIGSLRDGIAEAIEDNTILVEGKPAEILETFLQQLDQDGAIDYQPTEAFIHIRKAVSK